MIVTRLLDQAFRFRPSTHRQDSLCRVRHFHGALGHIVVLTELPDNTGMSVTNAAEMLIPSIAQAFLHQDPEDVIWIEHYPTRGDTAPTFDRVRLTPDGTEVRWEHLPALIVGAMVGEEILAE